MSVDDQDQEPLLGDATEIGYVPEMPTYQDELDHIVQLQDVDKAGLQVGSTSSAEK